MPMSSTATSCCLRILAMIAYADISVIDDATKFVTAAT